MDYFTDLLESYSRLKQRKLVLLEKEEKKKEKPDKVIQEYTPEQVLTAALGTPVFQRTPVAISWTRSQKTTMVMKKLLLDTRNHLEKVKCMERSLPTNAN